MTQILSSGAPKFFLKSEEAESLHLKQSALISKEAVYVQCQKLCPIVSNGFEIKEGNKQC